MQRSDVPWRGYWPAAPTPYTADGKLDENALVRLLALYVDQGVHGVLINGTTGEWFSQTRAERRRVAEIAVATVAGRIPVVVGCTSYTPGETIELAREVKAIGADGALATPPPYAQDRKSTRLNSSHVSISYAVFCLQRKRNVPMRRRR